MATYLPIVIIALAVSLDGCGVGLLYGARRIRIPPLSLLIIACCSGFVIWCSMKAGVYVAQWIPADKAKAAGAVILVMIGLWAIVQFARQQRQDDREQAEPQGGGESGVAEGSEEVGEVGGVGERERLPVAPARPAEAVAGPRAVAAPESRTVLRIELRKIGLVIQILRTPAIADIDRSGNISAWEASLLGIALSLDALGAGIGAALVGYSALPTAVLIAVTSGLFIAVGLRIGRLATGLRWLRRMTLLPGLLLILMGVMKLFSI